MTPEELKEAVLALDNEARKAFLLDALPELAKDAMQDQMFLMQLFPIFVNLLKESGIELSQLLQMASMFAPAGGADQN
ncbi:hypothetical protein A7E78_08785 [Syntrophotalea acetylenivorans]|uniref:Uncharacterized protein n=1 Tax=Syntrophotalea acetylenivorans TaxID=1842532 RepID=A0A1L3GPR9_9BACT|nr:hypothetical protein [Syntrophotalea acetylenivorans]APG27922.1 hypothetical protein A7E78_08785 [Syntrophotalea acetylenivorans]